MPSNQELEALRRLGDPEADPFMDRIVRTHGIHALAGLLDSLFRWSPGAVFPASSTGSSALWAPKKPTPASPVPA